jgi:hypothetical protein
MRGRSAALFLEQLFLFVFFEKSSCLFQVEGGSVHGQLIYTSVFRDGDDVLNTMASVS